MHYNCDEHVGKVRIGHMFLHRRHNSILSQSRALKEATKIDILRLAIHLHASPSQPSKTHRLNLHEPLLLALLRPTLIIIQK